MDSQKPIVCFGCYDYWNSNPGSPIQITDAMHSAGHKVLWINNIGMNMPKIGKHGFTRRVFLKFKSWLRWLKPHRPGFYILSPIILPLFGNPTVEKLNEKWLLFQIKLAYIILGLKQPLAFVCMPSFGNVVGKLNHSGMIYYYTDKYDSYRDITAKASITDRDQLLFETADIVLCASQKITDSLKNKRSDVYYLPHAVDFRSFNSIMESDTTIPEDMANIPEPRIGYFGSLTDSNDLEVIRYAATEDPSLQFVLIGRVFGDYSIISELPNVHLLGFKPYSEIPLYGKYFNAGIMNWKMTEWIKHCSPVKTKEYLSLGLPVVSCPIEEVVNSYKGIVEIAETGPEFLSAIHKVLQDDSSELRQMRIDRMRNESWDMRVQEIFKYYESSKS